MKVRLRLIAVPLVVSAAIFVKEGFEFGAFLIGIALWGVFVGFCLAAAAVFAGLACAYTSARQRRLVRPSWTTVTPSLLVAFVLLFPVQATWDTVEGSDSAGGLTAAANAALLRANVVDHPTLWYTEECCG